MPVAVLVTEICAPGITPPDESVIVPDRVAPVTCECIEMAPESIKTKAIDVATVL